MIVVALSILVRDWWQRKTKSPKRICPSPSIQDSHADDDGREEDEEEEDAEEEEDGRLKDVITTSDVDQFSASVPLLVTATKQSRNSKETVKFRSSTEEEENDEGKRHTHSPSQPMPSILCPRWPVT